MKNLRFILVFAALAIFSSSAFATVWTVSNVTDRPAQFTDIQTAVDSASPGDTILITGGGASYGNVTNYIPLTFIGESNSASGETVQIGGQLYLYRLNSSLSASGTRIYGLNFNFIDRIVVDGNFSGSSSGQEDMSDIIIERCFFNYGCGVTFNAANYGTYSNITIRNCVFNSGNDGINISEFDVSSILITNCVFTNCYIVGYGNVNSNVLVRNNLFLDRTTSVFNSITGLIVENNIFYKAEPTGLGSSAFNNNLTYLCNSNTIPYGSNIGSGNIVNADPLFKNYPALGGAFSFAHNYGLQSGSPADGTGTNGTDIGLTGGNSPQQNIPQYPKIPDVINVSIPVSSVPAGGTLQINVEAITRD